MELTNSDVKTRDERPIYKVICNATIYRSDGKVDCYQPYATFKHYGHAKRWIKNNQSKKGEYLIFEDIVWIAGKDINYIKGKRKKYWDC